VRSTFEDEEDLAVVAVHVHRAAVAARGLKGQHRERAGRVLAAFWQSCVDRGMVGPSYW
jgi:hypothetical protein